MGATFGRDANTNGRRIEVTQKWLGRTVVVAVAGELDMLTTPQLEAAIEAALAHGPDAMVVDLSAVTFLASSGMNLLMSTHHKLARTARFAVVADGPATGRPLQLMGLDRVFAVHPTLDAAVGAPESR